MHIYNAVEKGSLIQMPHKRPHVAKYVTVKISFLEWKNVYLTGLRTEIQV